ncbi:MAG: transcription antitermination factor NusB, partial [Paracoccus sp. (in: a-proteobacteria)]
MTEARQNSRSGSDRRALSGAARLYAVQALFQMEAAGQSADRVQREFETYRIGAED